MKEGKKRDVGGGKNKHIPNIHSNSQDGRTVYNSSLTDVINNMIISNIHQTNQKSGIWIIRNGDHHSM